MARRGLGYGHPPRAPIDHRGRDRRTGFSAGLRTAISFWKSGIRGKSPGNRRNSFDSPAASGTGPTPAPRPGGRFYPIGTRIPGWCADCSRDISPAEKCSGLRIGTPRRERDLKRADVASGGPVGQSGDRQLRAGEKVLARRRGEELLVAEAIGAQYMTVPPSRIGLVVALADRLDSLAGLFAAGLAPSGAKDPFGLRRAAIGVVQPLIEHGLDLDLAAAVAEAASLEPIPAGQDVQNQVLDFIAGRLSVVLKERGQKYDVVDAVLAEQARDPASAARAVEHLQRWVQRPDWGTILPAFARCVRITRDQRQAFPVKEQGFQEKEEGALYTAIQQAEAALGKKAETSVDDFLNTFTPMIPAINAFFDKVLVMAEDRTVRENRLALLQRIAAMPRGLADLSKLEGF